MIERYIDIAISPIAKVLQYDYVEKPMKPLGTNNTMKIARAYNRLVYGKYHEHRKNRYLNNFDELIRENGGTASAAANEIRDGWALDTSGTLPHLERLLYDAGEIIKEHGGVKRTDYGRPWFQEIPVDNLIAGYPKCFRPYQGTSASCPSSRPLCRTGSGSTNPGLSTTTPRRTSSGEASSFTSTTTTAPWPT
jgi:hypothetical protein